MPNFYQTANLFSDEGIYSSTGDLRGQLISWLTATKLFCLVLYRLIIQHFTVKAELIMIL